MVAVKGRAGEWGEGAAGMAVIGKPPGYRANPNRARNPSLRRGDANCYEISTSVAAGIRSRRAMPAALTLGGPAGMPDQEMV
jgi:hypothetical protein